MDGMVSQGQGVRLKSRGGVMLARKGARVRQCGEPEKGASLEGRGVAMVGSNSARDGVVSQGQGASLEDRGW